MKKRSATAVATEHESSALEAILQERRGQTADQHGVPRELVLAQIVELSVQGATVEFELDGESHRLVALATQLPTANDLGRAAVLSFLDGDLAKPVILGLLHRPSAENSPERLELSAEQELVLRCGDATLTLSESGKVEIRAKSLTSRADGVHRILGGSVQIN